MFGNTDPQEKLNQLNADLRKELVMMGNLSDAEKRDLERVKQRYGNDISRHQQTIARLTREIENLENEVRRSKK